MTDNMEALQELKNLVTIAFDNAEKMKAENKQLKKQIEKMKNCTNCKNNNGFGCTVKDDCEKFCRWELEE